MTRGYTQLSRTVREAGLLRRTPWFYGLVGFALLLGFGGCVTGFILLGQSWFQLLVAAGLGILFTQTAFLAHEAAHRAILTTGPGNDRLARLLGGIAGMSYAWWDAKHTRHHANPNRIGKDPDIEVDTISFLEEDAAASRGLRRLVTGRQGWLFWPLLAFEGANLHYLGVRHLVRREHVQGRWTELGTLAARFAIVLVPIFLLLPTGMAFAFLGVELVVFGVYMGSSFAPNHVGMPIIGRDERLDFLAKQVRTSRDIRGGWWATWLMGGLNHQVEHHLFPSMARPHLAATRAIVRDYCASRDVPYTEATLVEAHGIVIRYLNDVGLAARDPFACPMIVQYRRT